MLSAYAGAIPSLYLVPCHSGIGLHGMYDDLMSRASARYTLILNRVVIRTNNRTLNTLPATSYSTTES